MRQKWPWVLAGGIVLFTASDIALRLTQSSGFLTLTLVTGAFVVPVAMVTFFYERIRDRDISVRLLAGGFIFGGAIGLAAAVLLEYWAITRLGLGALAAVGFIEEPAKLIFPVIMYLLWRHRHEGDGLNFGVAAGMGFAALETVGYGLMALAQSQGNVGALEQTLALRGLLSPAGHAAWTGMVCAVLWRERERAGSKVINASVISTFLLAVSLHIAWNAFSTLNLPDAAAIAGLVAVAAVSFSLLLARYREARRFKAAPAADIS